MGGRIGIVAGELSGDRLGGKLVTALRQLDPSLQFVGIGGPNMIAAGVTSLASLEKLAVMGIMEVLPKLPELFALRRRILAELTREPLDLWIGIDAPDFNLPIAAYLKKRCKIKTVHVVSPSVWAWRSGRMVKIKRSIDLMLLLFPFEQPIYRKWQMSAQFIGHPLADEVPFELPSQAAVRRQLGLTETGRIIALLPGSRKTEVQALIHPFLKAAELVQSRYNDCHFLLSAANEQRANELTQSLAHYRLPLTIHREPVPLVLRAAEVALVASGTATLEALLWGCPLVAAYRTHPVTAWLARRWVTARYFSLPNLLADAPLITERFQEQVVGPRLAVDLIELLENLTKNNEQKQQFKRISGTLRQQADQRAALAVMTLLPQGLRNYSAL